jgi:hypothetical protein
MFTKSPTTIPDEIEREINRARELLHSIGFAPDAIQLHTGHPLHSPLAYRLWLLAPFTEIAPILQLVVEAGFGFNLHVTGLRDALMIQFHNQSAHIHFYGSKYRFDQDTDGFWGATRLY